MEQMWKSELPDTTDIIISGKRNVKDLGKIASGDIELSEHKRATVASLRRIVGWSYEPYGRTTEGR